ncbi:hypothetical protein GCM10009631_21890 [Corynebacterium glaucum]|nr:hypothetical protein [Corynebacterium glaucum]
MRMKIRAFAASALVAGTLIASPTASADIVDDALAALPSGPISCEQAQRYWTDEADYYNKVAQAQMVARFDPRGPQILAALARVDEAATRCGLKGGGAAPAQQQAPAPAPSQPAPNQPAPAQPVPSQPGNAQQGQAPVLLNLAPANSPSFELPVADMGSVVLPDVLELVRQALAGILDSFNIKVPGINA